ncbi:MAG TPA: glycosyl hydrolase family 65 protein [Fimbriimonadaceae bacterium]|nr:glycosyl hydrolase family 65 protein [Fimbriimonadaceae bacterium]
MTLGCSRGAAPTKSLRVDPWILVCRDPKIETPAYLGNGSVGARIGRDGTVVEAMRLDSTKGLVDIDVQSGGLMYDGRRIDVKRGERYSQTLDMKRGMLTTSWIQVLGGTQLRIKNIRHDDAPLESEWYVTSSQHGMFVDPAGRLHPLTAGRETLFIVGDRTEAPVQHGERPTITIEGSDADTQAIQSFIYYLAHLVPSRGAATPFGPSNRTYGSDVFWDADCWIVPALALVYPDQAAETGRYRIKTYSGAKAYRYPWQSGPVGEDDSTGPTKKEEHTSADVAWGLDFAASLGLVDREDAESVGRAVARHYLERVARVPDGKSEILDVTGVDEWFEGDDCLYTNAAADWAIKRFLGQDVNMGYPRNSSGELVAYKGDPEKAYQQAAAPLILWPLERDDLVAKPLEFLERFEGKDSPDGPAMSLSVYALIRARYGDAEGAYKEWRESWMRYTEGNPLLLFSERTGRRDLTYFATGAAGCLNAVIYGFMGARIVDDTPKDEAKIALKDGRWLVFRPNLPAAWKRVTFTGLHVLGQRYTIVCERGSATIARAD